jgi:hypothetical protein
MNSPPRPKQHLALSLYLNHDPPHVRPADPDNPLQGKTARTSQINLGLSTLAEDVHVGRLMVVGEDHETEPERPMDGYHD